MAMPAPCLRKNPRPVRRWLSVALLGVAAGFAVPQLGRACTLALRFVAGPPEGAQLPANLTYFSVLGEEQGVEAVLLDLDSGGVVPTHIETRAGDRILAPDGPLQAGMKLALVERARDGASERARYTFATIAAAPIELRPPRLQVVRDTGNQVVVRYDSPDATGSAQHLITVDARLDGRPLWSESVDSYTFVVSSPCDGTTTYSSCGNVLTVDEGPHELEVSAHVLGSDVQPDTLRMSVETHCDSGCSATGARPEGAFGFGLVAALLLGYSRRRSG